MAALAMIASGLSAPLTDIFVDLAEAIGLANDTPVDADRPDDDDRDGHPDPDPDRAGVPADCRPTIANSCDEHGNCHSFEPLACSPSPAAQDAYIQSAVYDYCSEGNASILLCLDYSPPLIEAGMRALLKAEVGADPGELFLLAAHICDASVRTGAPGDIQACRFTKTMADYFHRYRSAIAIAAVVGDIIPGPRGLVCVTSSLDGSFTRGDLAECGLSLSTGVSVPFPSGFLDE